MKRVVNLGFWFFSILYLEMVLKITLFDNIFNINIINLILFTMPFALIFNVVTSLFNKKKNAIIHTVLISFLTLVFIAQIVYYKTYLSIFSIYSIGSGTGQVIEFMDTIFKMMKQNVLPILFMFLPLIGFIVFNKKLL